MRAASESKPHDLVTFVVGSGDAIYAHRDALAENNAYFRRFFHGSPQCQEVRLHHTRYAAAQAALALCENGQDDPFFRLCRRVNEARADWLETQSHARHFVSQRGDGRAGSVESAAKEYRSAFKDVVSLIENCILYGLDWHAGRAVQVACAHMDQPSHLLLSLRASLSLCVPLDNLVRSVTQRLTAPTSSSTGAMGEAGLTLLCACVRQLVVPVISDDFAQKVRAEKEWHSVVAQHPVLPELLRTAAGVCCPRKPCLATTPPHSIHLESSATRFQGVRAATATTVAALADTTTANAVNEEELRVSRLVEQLQSVVLSLTHTVEDEAARHERELTALDQRQLRDLAQGTEAARNSLAALQDHITAQQASNQRLTTDLMERRDECQIHCEYLDDVRIYTTALRTAVEEMEHFVALSRATLLREGTQTPEDAVRRCASHYRARAHALRGEREITLRRIAAEEAEQEEREATIMSLR